MLGPSPSGIQWFLVNSITNGYHACTSPPRLPARYHRASFFLIPSTP